MKRFAKLVRIWRFWRFFSIFAWLALQPRPGYSQPVLSVRIADLQNVEISWPATSQGFSLEQTTTLSDATGWQTINAVPALQVDHFTLALPLSHTKQFLRLHQADNLTTITSSSPLAGETGVAVTRETILHFSAPLSSNTVLTANNFFAGFGGRKLLSRVELSADRKTATLFYLEPLPGSTRVDVVFDGTGVKDDRGQPLDADGDGMAGGSALIEFETLNLTSLSGTAVIGTVYASELAPGPDTGTNAVNKPLAGVTITVDGMEQTLRTRTDASGNFMLNPVPPGRFFVHIDGRTVTNNAAGIHYPDKAYYPFVGKAWEAVAGRTNNLAGGTGKIYLPLITAGTLQPVSMTSDTVISFPPSVVANNPALAGVSITVPANSLFSDNGSRGGKVGIAPVPPDRLPGPLPEGLELPIVITVQSDGPSNFDKPVPICFPNLPDPVLKAPLPAGSKQALISFNHDKGIWEAVGSMTVSADGKTICSDPGTGILQPGWEGCGPAPIGPIPVEPCKPSPDGLEQGLTVCQWEDDDCKKANRLLKTVNEKICRDRFEAGIYDRSSYKDCLATALHIHKNRLAQCLEQYVECVNDVRDCFTPTPKPDPEPESESPSDDAANSQEGRRSAFGAPSLLERVFQILDQADSLILPFADSGSEIPDAIFDQALALQDQAKTLAGGDLTQFFENEIIKGEREVAGQGTITTRGNAPAYPVLYAAEILRPSGILVLRGETGPFGNYSLFIPRDGILSRVVFYDSKTRRAGVIFPFRRPDAPPGLRRFTLTPIDESYLDSDADALPDDVEFVYGTDPLNQDSDHDGIPDGAEVDQGTNPLDGQAVRIGIVGTARMPGTAIDLAAANDLLAVAEGASGVSLVSVANPMNPVLVGQVDTPGNAQAIAISGNLVAVADGDQGLAIIDATDRSKAQIIHQVPLNGTAHGVALAGNVAYVGLETADPVNSGAIGTVDLITGAILDRFAFGSSLLNGSHVSGDGFNDLTVSGEELYVATVLTLTVYRVGGTHPEIFGQVQVGGGGTRGFRKVFVGGGFAYISHVKGYSVVDVRNPAKPKIVAEPPGGQFSLIDLALNGSGSLLGSTIGPGTQAFAVSLYDASQPNDVTKYLTTFLTPGSAQAVTIHNGLAYVADSTAGIQAINYLPFDSGGKAPAITLSTSQTNGSVEAGSALLVTANATDDVQVRNVQFYVEGIKAFTDGNFPFEYRFDAPPRTVAKTNVVLRARAVDTGGNFTWSDEVTIPLNQDATPPRVLVSTPLGGGKAVRTLKAFFSEPMDPTTVTNCFQLLGAGPDNQLGTADDVPVSGGTVVYDAATRSATLGFATPLPGGLYRAVVSTTAMDLSGNPLAAEYSWQFRVADAVFWTRSTDGFWDDPTSWSTGSVPGPTDDIVIESIPTDPTITIGRGSGPHVFKTLVVGERVVVDGGTLKSGSIIHSGNGRLIFTGNAGNTLDGVNVLGDLDLTNPGATTLIRNGLSVSGSILLKDTLVTFAGSQTFNGHVVLTGFSQLTIQPGTTFTLGPAAVVQGKGGTLGGGEFGTRILINQGLISVDGADPSGLFFSPTQFENAGRIEGKNGGSITVQGGDSRNTGQINLTGGATLTLKGAWHNPGTINQTDSSVVLGNTFTLADIGTIKRTFGATTLIGVLDLGGGTLAFNAATGSWQIDGGTLKNGTLTQADGAKLTFSRNGQNVLDKIRVEGDLESNGGIVVRNGLTLTGNVILGNAAITFAGTQTFDNARITFNGFSQVLIQPGTTLTLGPAVVVEGKIGALGGGEFGTRKLINQGLILSDVPGGMLTINPTSFENPGTLRADGAGATLVVKVTPFTNTGTISELNGGKVLINP